MTKLLTIWFAPWSMGMRAAGRVWLALDNRYGKPVTYYP